MPNDNQVAVVTSSGPSKIPVLSAGELSIEVYLQWKHMCEDCFELKDIDEPKKRIIHAMTGVLAPLVRNWYQADKARIQALTWEAFAVEFRDRWLPPNWEQRTRNLLIRSRQAATDSFKDWVVKIETHNANLFGTTSHKDETQLREHIESVMCDRLVQLAETADVASIAGYKAWKDRLTNLDNERIANMNEMIRLAGKLANTRTTSSSTLR